MPWTHSFCSIGRRQPSFQGIGGFYKQELTIFHHDLNGSFLPLLQDLEQKIDYPPSSTDFSTCVDPVKRSYPEVGEVLAGVIMKWSAAGFTGAVCQGRRESKDGLRMRVSLRMSQTLKRSGVRGEWTGKQTLANASRNIVQ